MKTFKLVGKKTNEAINKVDANSLGEAIEYFAKIKNLTTKMLLSVYDVVKN
jgi:hypothetical protein